MTTSYDYRPDFRELLHGAEDSSVVSCVSFVACVSCVSYVCVFCIVVAFVGIAVAAAGIIVADVGIVVEVVNAACSAATCCNIWQGCACA